MSQKLQITDNIVSKGDEAMEQKRSNKSNKTLLAIGKLLFILLIVFDVYLFFTKTSMVVKSLSAGSFVLLVALLVLSLSKTPKSQN